MLALIHPKLTSLYPCSILVLIMSETVKFMFNKRTELTIYGWIRKINTEIKLNIPCVIKNLVGAFFRIYDKFLHHLYGQCTIDQNGKRISTVRENPSGNCTLHGEIKIKRNQFIQWQFQIIKFGNKTGSTSSIHFMSFGVKVHCRSRKQHGIWNVKSIQKIQGQWQKGQLENGKWQEGKWISKESYYHIGEIQEYYSEDTYNDEEGVCNEEPDQRIIWKQGDTLTMQFDHGKLRYQVNNKQPHLIFNIPSEFECFTLYAEIPYDSKVKMTQFFIE